MRQVDVICIGSVLWDLVGRSDETMPWGADRPGRIRRLPGGVAMNIAMTLARFGRAPALLSVVGDDREGRALLDEAARLGIEGRHILCSPDLPTDRYMAIECPDGLVAAIADAHSLEAAGDAILAPMGDGRLGSAAAPWAGVVALDGNLTEALLAQIAVSALFARADLRVAPASPGKATRLLALRAHRGASYYVNLEEAGLLAGQEFDDAAQAARALVAGGLARAIVTDGARASADATPDYCISVIPPPVPQMCVTGAGDCFFAAHVASEMEGAVPRDALEAAARAASEHVSGGHS